MFVANKVHAERSIASGSVKLYAIQNKISGKFAYANSPCFTECEAGSGMSILPVVEISEDAAQQLLNDLWSAGYRPHKNGHGGDAHVEAMKEHIADLRRMAFPPEQVRIETIKDAVGGDWGGGT